MIASLPKWWRSDRLRALVAVALVHVLLAAGLIVGLTVKFADRHEAIARLIDVRLLPPPRLEQPPPPPRPTQQRPASQDSAPKAVPDRLGGSTGPSQHPLAIPVAPLVIASPPPAPGGSAGSGAAIGTGSGGGDGGDGEGAGSGDGGGDLEWLAGEIRRSDYPRGPLRAGAGGRVEFRYIVGIRGRVTACGITRSSGNRDLDIATCRLVMKRFRYRPATDAFGRPVVAEVEGEQIWTIDERRRD
jgi:protein TonB